MSVAQTLNIVIVLFYQIVFFHESVTITSLIGVFLIILSVMIIGFKDMLAEAQFFNKTVKKLSKSSNKTFNLNTEDSIKKEKDKNNFIFQTSEMAKNYGIKVLPSSQFPSYQTNNLGSVCIVGNCKNNLCFNQKDEQNDLKAQEAQKNMYLNLPFYEPSKYITYNKNDIY